MRHTVPITIEDEGRDKGKTFVITEMPAVQGEKWASQLLSLLIKSGINLPEIPEEDSGMAGLAALGDAAAPLIAVLHDPSLESWWDCVKYEHKPGAPLQAIMQGEGCQIEEIRTITHLRMEVLKLHTGFFSRANPSTSASRSPTATGSLPTRTSRRPSAA